MLHLYTKVGTHLGALLMIVLQIESRDSDEYIRLVIHDISPATRSHGNKVTLWCLPTGIVLDHHVQCGAIEVDISIPTVLV